MIDLHRAVLEEFAEAQRKGRGKDFVWWLRTDNRTALEKTKKARAAASRPGLRLRPSYKILSLPPSPAAIRAIEFKARQRSQGSLP